MYVIRKQFGQVLALTSETERWREIERERGRERGWEGGLVGIVVGWRGKILCFQ